MKHYYVGIDIGSTASKVVVLGDGTLADAFVLPTGWNGRETARQIYELLQKKAIRTICAVLPRATAVFP